MTQRAWDAARRRVIALLESETRDPRAADPEMTMALQVLQHYTGHLTRERLDGVIRGLDAHWRQQQQQQQQQ